MDLAKLDLQIWALIFDAVVARVRRPVLEQLNSQAARSTDPVWHQMTNNVYYPVRDRERLVCSLITAQAKEDINESG